VEISSTFSMLTRLGDFDEEDLITAAKWYLPLYGVKEKEECKIPFKDLDDGRVKQLVFVWLAGQWVFISIKN
jgi:hypothetical protein